MSTSLVDQDIVAFHQEEDQTAVQIFFIRSGKLISAEHHILEDTRGENLKDIINTYLKQFYGDSAFIPREILIQVDIDDRENIEKWLTKRQGIRVHIRYPKGEKNSNWSKWLCEMPKNLCKHIIEKRKESMPVLVVQY